MLEQIGLRPQFLRRCPALSDLHAFFALPKGRFHESVLLPAVSLVLEALSMKLHRQYFAHTAQALCIDIAPLSVRISIVEIRST